MDYESTFTLMLSDAAHLAPDSGVLTVGQAHRAMRIHRACQRAQCELKDLAVKTLREAGQLRDASDFDRAGR